MKTTKRILARITALVLCLAPMALMTLAAETVPCATRDLYCLRCNYSDVTYVSCKQTLTRRLNVGTYEVCQYNEYLVGHLVCNRSSCGYAEPDYIYRTSQHPTIYYNEDRTMRYCRVCGYEEYGDY